MHKEEHVSSTPNVLQQQWSRVKQTTVVTPVWQDRPHCGAEAWQASSIARSWSRTLAASSIARSATLWSRTLASLQYCKVGHTVEQNLGKPPVLQGRPHCLSRSLASLQYCKVSHTVEQNLGKPPVLQGQPHCGAEPWQASSIVRLATLWSRTSSIARSATLWSRTLASLQYCKVGHTVEQNLGKPPVLQGRPHCGAEPWQASEAEIKTRHKKNMYTEALSSVNKVFPRP